MRSNNLRKISKTNTSTSLSIYKLNARRLINCTDAIGYEELEVKSINKTRDNCRKKVWLIYLQSKCIVFIRPSNFRNITFIELTANLFKNDIFEQLFSSNEILPQNQTYITAFHSKSVPSMPLDTYFLRIMKYTENSPECAVLALKLLERYLLSVPYAQFDKLTAHRLLLALMWVATSYLCGEYINKESWALIGGVSLKELNHLIVELLNAINHECFITSNEFMKTHTLLMINIVQYHSGMINLLSDVGQSVVQSNYIQTSSDAHMKLSMRAQFFNKSTEHTNDPSEQYNSEFKSQTKNQFSPFNKQMVSLSELKLISNERYLMRVSMFVKKSSSKKLCQRITRIFSANCVIL